jgi:hypothetical protein
MTTIDLDLIDENDDFNAASINTRFVAVRSGLLDIPEYAIEEHGLGPAHLPSLVIDIGATPGLSRSFSISPVYTASPPTYTTWGADASFDVVSDGSGGTTTTSGDLEILFTTMILGMNQAARVGALVVFANLALTLPPNNDTFVFCLQYKDGSDVWQTIKNTETIVAPGRMAITATQRTMDVSINTILRATTEIAGACKGLRVAHSTKLAGADYYINKGELTIIPLHCAVA